MATLVRLWVVKKWPGGAIALRDASSLRLEKATVAFTSVHFVHEHWYNAREMAGIFFGTPVPADAEWSQFDELPDSIKENHLRVRYKIRDGLRDGLEVQLVTMNKPDGEEPCPYSGAP